MEFKYLIIDANNLGYHVINSVIDRSITRVSNKFIYKNFVSKYIETINTLVKTYSSSEVILLFDNHNSKEELRLAFTPVAGIGRKEIKETYKANRKRETDEFYWSLDFIKYYYMVTDTNFHTVQIMKLEADDLVLPCLRTIVKDLTALLITNDSDWTKYLTDSILYLPNIYDSPKGVTEFIYKHGYTPTEDKVVLDKVLFGDTADNISQVFPEIKPEIKRKILNDFDSVFDLILYASQKDYLKEFVSLIKDRENELKVNYQLITALPVSDEQFLSHYTTGRGSEKLKSALNKILYGSEKAEIKFTFGGIKTPRIIPKSQ